MSTPFFKWRDKVTTKMEGDFVRAGFLPTIAASYVDMVRFLMDEAHTYVQEEKDVDDDIIDTVAVDYGLDVILEQNDIKPGYVLRWLVAEGLVDMDDYVGEGIADD